MTLKRFAMVSFSPFHPTQIHPFKFKEIYADKRLRNVANNPLFFQNTDGHTIIVVSRRSTGRSGIPSVLSEDAYWETSGRLFLAGVRKSDMSERSLDRDETAELVYSVM